MSDRQSQDNATTNEFELVIRRIKIYTMSVATSRELLFPCLFREFYTELYF